MTINNKIRREANRIISKYCGFKLPSEISKMYDELEAIGISIPMFSSTYTHSHPFEYNGELVENSCFVYSVYEPINGLKNDYTMYIS